MDIYEQLVELSVPLCEVTLSDLSQQPWDDYETARELAEINLPEFRRIIQKAASGGHVKVTVDIKCEESFESKIKRGSSPEKITDFLRGRIFTRDQEQLDYISSRLYRRAKISSYERKEHPDPNFGYHGPHHIIIEVGSGDTAMLAEIQVMTNAMSAAGEVAHPLYSDHREKTKEQLETDPAALRDRKQSREVFKFGTKPRARARAKEPRMERRHRHRFEDF